jgi:hypothetical protein
VATEAPVMLSRSTFVVGSELVIVIAAWDIPEVARHRTIFSNGCFSMAVFGLAQDERDFLVGRRYFFQFTNFAAPWNNGYKHAELGQFAQKNANPDLFMDSLSIIPVKRPHLFRVRTMSPTPPLKSPRHLAHEKLAPFKCKKEKAPCTP